MTDADLHSGPAGFADAVTVTFADAERGWFGMARLGRADGTGSALAVLFRGREPVAALAEGSLQPSGEDWADLRVGPLHSSVNAGFERWTVGWDDHFALELEAASAPVERRGGMEGYEQLVRVRGTVTVDGETAEIDGLGQRGHAWGVVDWSSLELVRGVSAWLGEGGIVLESLRPERANGHDAEEIWASLVEHGDPVPVIDPRLSTTYDGDGHQRRAGLELWLTDEAGYPVRAAGEVICGSSLELGALRLDLAFFAWTSEGSRGVGRYDVLRKVAS